MVCAMQKPTVDDCALLSVECVATTYTNLSTAMATKVKTEAETDTPCTKPLILQTALEKGQPVDKTEPSRVIHMFMAEAHSEQGLSVSNILCQPHLLSPLSHFPLM